MRLWENHAHSEVWVRLLHGSPLPFESQQTITRQTMTRRHVPPHYCSARTRPTRRHLLSSLHCIIWMANKGLSNQTIQSLFLSWHVVFNSWNWIPFWRTLWIHMNLTWIKLSSEGGREGNGYILAGQDTRHRLISRKPTPNITGFHSTTSSRCTLSTYYVSGARKKREVKICLSILQTHIGKW